MRACHIARRILPLFLLASVIFTVGPRANPVLSVYLDLVEPGANAPAVTQNCSSWHELYPNYCMIHHQDAFDDNGDGVLSECDWITLDGERWHIDWVGPTYYLSNGQIYEPMDPPTGADPVCETWHQVHPAFGTLSHVDEWLDNGDGVVSVCDQVAIGGQIAHIDRIGVNIQVSGPVAIERSTWGKLKNFFGRLF